MNGNIMKMLGKEHNITNLNDSIHVIGGDVWLIKKEDHYVIPSGTRDKNMLESLYSSNPCLSNGWLKL